MPEALLYTAKFVCQMTLHKLKGQILTQVKIRLVGDLDAFVWIKIFILYLIDEADDNE